MKDELELGANIISQDICGFITVQKLTGRKPIQLGKRCIMVVAVAQVIKQSFEAYLLERINREMANNPSVNLEGKAPKGEHVMCCSGLKFQFKV